MHETHYVYPCAIISSDHGKEWEKLVRTSLSQVLTETFKSKNPFLLSSSVGEEWVSFHGVESVLIEEPVRPVIENKT